LKILQKRKTAVHPDDTRSRLLEAAAAIFAESGYQAATTRQICIRAGANAAAVNYHFGDKLGLYKAVLKSFIGRQESHVEERALAAMPPELALRSFIRAMFESLGAADAPDQYTRVMAHEIVEPTPGLAMMVDQIIVPRAHLLCNIVARLTADPARSQRVRLAAHSIMAQIVHYMHARPVIKLLWPRWRMSAAARRQMVEHVTNFSLAGLRGTVKTQHGDAGRSARRRKGAASRS
jgi:TetR/AcrR family transcriptional regulator, regulator of cefoperazone and chloramphenicol sensitivity